MYCLKTCFIGEWESGFVRFWKCRIYITPLSYRQTSLFVSGRYKNSNKSIMRQCLNLITSQRGHELLHFNGYIYSKSKIVKGRTYWSCRFRNEANQYCKARLITWPHEGGFMIKYSFIEHNHKAPSKRIENAMG